jgi:peptidoglycan/LPS O-acetylase OafA/YrhL
MTTQTDAPPLHSSRSSEGERVGAAAAPRRIEYVDGLRALAALWVVVHHTIETSIPAKLLALPVIGWALASLFFGQFPVMVFLMLSGFCLYYPYVRKSPARPEFRAGYRAFLVRRAKRICPPYLWAGAFCLIMAAIPQLQVGRWKLVGPVNAKIVLSHFLMVHNLIPSHASKIDYPMWSIGLEWQLYLLFPLMMWAILRGRAPVVIGVTLGIAALIRGTYRSLPQAWGAVLHDGPFSYLEIFAAGMFAAALTVNQKRLAPPWVLGGAAVAAMVVVRLGSGNGLVHDMSTSVAAFSVLLLAMDADGTVSRFLSTPRLVKIGVFSYSLYLVHAPLVHLTWFALQPLHLSQDVLFLVLVGAGIPLIILASYGFHVLFERPFMTVVRSQPGTVAARRVDESVVAASRALDEDGKGTRICL